MAIAKKKLPTATPEEFEGATLMRMRMENIKRVRLIDLTFDQSLTVIGGDFSQGKSTYLSGYEWCFGGKAVIDLDPIQHGKQSGTIVCEIGDGEKVTLRATCLLERVGESGWTRSIDLEIPGHMTPSKVQDFLDALAGKRSFDPMSFDAMKAEQQYETLRALVANFDFAANKTAYDTTFKERTDINRDQKREQAAADAIVITAESPCERIDEEALSLEMQEAGQKNLDREKRRANRVRAEEIITESRKTAATVDQQIATAVQNAEVFRDRELARMEEQIAALQRQMEIARKECAQAIATETESLQAKATEATRHADELQAKLDSADPLPEVIDTQALIIKQSDARTSNKRLDDWTTLRSRKTAHQAEADRLAEKSAAFTKTLDALEAAKLKAIQDAKLPVEGIGFGDGFVTLNGVPWKQGGESERVDASTAIAMALNPRLKVILIRNGSGVAKRMRERIQQRASDKGYRVLMEVVDTPEGTHVVIEDGQVKAREPHKQAAPGAA